MDSRTFPQFPKLPPELRDRIWDHAVHPVPGERHVQRFIIVYNHYGHHAYSPYPIPGSFLKLHPKGHDGYKVQLAVPWERPGYEKNDSVYTLNSGLWMACRDSRAAMERCFSKNEWWSDLEIKNRPKCLAGPGKYFGENGASHTASYIDHNGQERIITFRPGVDLIHLDTLGLGCVDWFYFYAGDTETILDYRGYENAVPKPSFLGCDIAIDYDPAMLDIIEERPVHRCFTDIKINNESVVEMVNIFHYETSRTLWFIDYRLRRQRVESVHPDSLQAGGAVNSDADSPSTLRTVFHSGESQFIEVTREDMANWTIEPEEELMSNNKSVFEFFDILFVRGSPRIELEDPKRLRVLACQPFSKSPASRSIKASETECKVCHPPSPIRRNTRFEKGPHSDCLDEDLSFSDFNLFD